MATTNTIILSLVCLGQVVMGSSGEYGPYTFQANHIWLSYGFEKTTYESSLANAYNDGFVVIQNREVNSSPQFETNGWDEYVKGFGVEGADEGFWLGLEKMYQATKEGNWQLLQKYTFTNGSTAWFLFDDFLVGPRTTKYVLTLGPVREKHSQILIWKDNSYFLDGSGMPFSTHDNDNDRLGNENCAKSYKGGWWFHKWAWFCANCKKNVFYPFTPLVKGTLMAMRRKPKILG